MGLWRLGRGEGKTGTLKELGRNPERGMNGEDQAVGLSCQSPVESPKENWRDYTAVAVPNNGAP